MAHPVSLSMCFSSSHMTRNNERSLKSLNFKAKHENYGLLNANLDVAVSVDDIVRDGASVHAVDEVPLPRNPFWTGHHCHLVRKSHEKDLVSKYCSAALLSKSNQTMKKLTKARSMKVVRR